MKKRYKGFICVICTIILCLVANTSVLAAENRNNVLRFSDYNFKPMQAGVSGPSQTTYVVSLLYTYNAFYGGIDGGTADRWERPTSNQQYDMYNSVYIPAVNFWQITTPTLITEINALEDNSLFEAYKNRFYRVFDNYYSAMKAMDSSLLCTVNDSNVAANNQNLNQQKTAIENAKTQLQSLKDEVESKSYMYNLQQSIGNSVEGTSNEVVNLPETLWNTLGVIIGASSVGNAEVFGLGLSTINTVANNLLPYVTSLAYLVLFVSFGLSASEGALQLELYEPRGAVKILMRVAIAKALIDLSITISLAVIRIINGVAAGAVTTGIMLSTFSGDTLLDVLQNVWNFTTGIFNIANMVNFLISNIPNIVITVVIIKALVQILIKLVMRNFELGCLLCVAPIGFATLGGDSTKRYFTKYFGALIGAASQIIVIAISYNLVSYWLHNTLESGATVLVLSGEWIAMIIICAMSRFVSKPPASIQNIFVFT